MLGKVKMFVFSMNFAILICGGCSVQQTEVDFGYSIELTGAEIPDLRKCKVIHWKQHNEACVPNECGYAFLYDVLKENGLDAALTTEGLADYYVNRFPSVHVLQYTAANFESNVAEICRITGADKTNTSRDDVFNMGRIWGGFEDHRIGLQAELAIRGFVQERTFGTNMVVRMESLMVYESVFLPRTKSIGVSNSLVPVERVFRFYNYSGELFATVRVTIPHGFFTGYEYEQSIIAARKAIGQSLKEFLKNRQGARRVRLMRGSVEWRKRDANEPWRVTIPEVVSEGDVRTGAMRKSIVIALMLAALVLAVVYVRLKSRKRVSNCKFREKFSGIV